MKKFWIAIIIGITASAFWMQYPRTQEIKTDLAVPASKVKVFALSVAAPLALSPPIPMAAAQNPIQPSTRKQEWDLADSGFTPDMVAPWLRKGDVTQLIAFNGNETHQLTPDGKKDAGQATPLSGVVFVSNQKKLDQVEAERLRQSEAAFGKSELTKEELAIHTPLSHQAYEFVEFHPGLRDDRINRIKVPFLTEIHFAIQGPDFSFASPGLRPSPEQLKLIRSRVLSLGHGGEVILKVSGDGFVANTPGPDFAVYENVFTYLSPSGQEAFFQEFADVGVSDNKDGPYRWFNCAPETGALAGCAGAIPTDQGGDVFDLSVIGVKSFRYLILRDRGNNYNKEGENTEGFDLDAMQVTHGYI